jgi:hypothetical protein
MLLLLFGASAAGKTTVTSRLRGRLDGVSVHDFDEIGVPAQPTRRWRHDANERWLLRALEAERRDTDLLVAGQTPLGELLAAPSASRVRVRGCLLDCDDDTRRARLSERGSGWLRHAGGTLADHLAWGAWMRAHAADPLDRLDVIRGEEGLEWDWLEQRDLREWWPVPVIPSTQPTGLVEERVAEWVAHERALDR